MAKVILTSSKTINPSQQDIDETVARAINQLGFNFKENTKTVLIKPNLCYYWNYSTGETTDPRVVSSVIDYLRNQLGEDIDITIAEADASAMKTKYAYKVLEYDKLAQDKNVKLANLSEGDINDVKVKVEEQEFTLPINNLLLKSDLLVNIPKLKSHNVVGMTCSLKNMFGAISKPRKYSYHKMLPQTIVGVNKIVKSHLIIVDGIITRGSYTKKLGVILAGDNPLTTDFVAAKIMGYTTRTIRHLRIAQKEKIGQTKNISLIEDNVKLVEIKDRFPSYNHFIHRLSWDIQLKMLELYSRMVGDVLPSILEE